MTVARMLLGLPVIAGLSAPSNAARSEEPPAAPVLSADGLDSACAVGEPIAFTLRLSNPTDRAMAVIRFDEDMVRNVMELVATVVRPDGSEFRILAQRSRSMLVIVDSSLVGELGPRDTLSLPARWGGRYSDWTYMWSVFSREEWEDFGRSGSYTVNDDLLAVCFDQPGEYTIRFTLDVGSQGLFLSPPFPRGEPWTGRLTSPDYRMRLCLQ